MGLKDTEHIIHTHQATIATIIIIIIISSSSSKVFASDSTDLYNKSKFH